MKAFFDKNRYAVYNKIKDAADNKSLSEDTRFVCKMILSEGRPSAFGYVITVNDFYKRHLESIGVVFE